MTRSSVLIRWIRRGDATDLQANCFLRNRLDEVQQQIERGVAEN